MEATHQDSDRPFRWHARVMGALHRHRLAVLLASLVLLILASPLADLSPRLRFVFIAATVAFFLACLRQVDRHPRLLWLMRALIALWAALYLPLPVPERVLVLLQEATFAVLTLSVLRLAAGRMLTARRVDSELLCGAFGGYLLVGVFWAEIDLIVTLFMPGAFATSSGAVPDQSALLYFSFTTLTTTGFGDIVAVNPILRMWTVLEAIVGTTYTATVIARLVSLYGRELSRKS